MITDVVEQEIVRLEREYADLKEVGKAMAKVLASFEKIDDVGGEYCPRCYQPSEEGHLEECPLAAALRAARANDLI